MSPRLVLLTQQLPQVLGGGFIADTSLYLNQGLFPR